MTNPNIRIKRSAVPGKRPSNSQIELGELALNTNDGRLFTKKENVGIGTTVTLLNVWTENVGGGAYYNDGAIGIGTSIPTSLLELYTSDGNIKLGDITAQPTTDVGISFSGLGTYTSAIFTELDGQILSYGINTPQIQNPRNTGRVGGIFRLDSRPPGGLGDSSCFVIKYAPVGFATTAGDPENGIKNGLILSLQDGKTYLVPDEGNVLVGLKTDTGTLNQKLQVLGGAYISGNIGVGTTNPTSRLHVVGDTLVTGVVTATAFNGNINSGIGTITNLSGTNVSYSGIGTVGSLNIGSTQVISSGRQLQNIASLDATTTATIETAIANAPNTFTDLQVTGLSTFTNGPVLIGSGTPTGTANQRLQVTGEAYVSGPVAIGTTRASGNLHIQSDSPTVYYVDANSTPDNKDWVNVANNKFLYWQAINDSGAGGGNHFRFEREGPEINYFDGIKGGLPWVRIDNLTARVGIGTSVPLDTLHVLSSTGKARFQNSNNNFSVTLDPQVSGPRIAFGSNSDNSLIEFGSYSATNNIDTKNIDFRLYSTSAPNAFSLRHSSGFVGIGTTNPLARLSVGNGSLGDGNLPIQISTQSVNGLIYYGANNNGSYGALFGYDRAGFDGGVVRVTGATDTLDLVVNNTRRAVTITPSGNTGIGTTNPQSLLEVHSNNDPGIIVRNSGTGVTGYLLAENSVFSIFTQSGSNKGVYLSANGGLPLILRRDGTVSVGQSIGVTGVTNVSSQLFQVGTASSVQGAYISGSVGIGTTNPSARLTVQGDVSIASTVSIGSSIDIIPYDNLGTLSFEGSAGQLFSITNNLTSGSIFSVNDVSGIPSIDVDANGTVQIAAYGGNLGVGTTNPTSKLHVVGDVLVSGAITSTDYNSASDINLKENIKPISDPIDKVMNITGVSFNWKAGGKSSMGVIAQEIEKVMPEIVSGGDSKTVNYNGLIGLLIEVVKEQQKEINMLKENMKRL